MRQATDQDIESWGTHITYMDGYHELTAPWLTVPPLACHSDWHGFLYRNKSPCNSFSRGFILVWATGVPLNYHDLYSFPYFLTSQVQTSDIQGHPPRTHPDPSFLSSLSTWPCCIPLCFLLSIHHFPVEMGIPSSKTWNAKCSKSEAFRVPTISRRGEFYTWLHVTDCSQNSDILKILRKIIYIHIYIVNRFGPLWPRYLIMHI